MTIHALVNGALFRAPEKKNSKSGRPFVSATIKARDGEATSWVKLLVFSDSAGAELMRLSDGDAVSAQGALKVETYDRDGLTKVSLTIVADQVLALRQPPRERKKPKQEDAPPRDTRPRNERWAGDGADVFGDDMPF